MKTIRVSAAVIHHDGLIYATRRGYGDFKGLWEFPGGKREAGESGEDAVIREIKEELGVEIKVDRFLLTVEYQYPEFKLVMDNYLCTIEKGHLELSVHDDAKCFRQMSLILSHGYRLIFWSLKLSGTASLSISDSM